MATTLPRAETTSRAPAAVPVGEGGVVTADVVVVGAGPAGTAAALTLARAGRHVVLVDKARFPRDKICGDGLTTGALRRLDELGLRPELVPSWQTVDEVVVRSPAGRVARFPLPASSGQFAAVARRRDLDAQLVTLAREAGVRLVEGRACIGVDQDDERVRVRLQGGTRVDAHYLVAADGMWSPIRKHLGVAVPHYLGEWHAFRQYIGAVGPAARGALHVYFEPDILPGYFWSFPVDADHANVGFGIRRGGNLPVAAMKGLWVELLARPHVRDLLGPDARAEGPHRAWPIPARPSGIVRATGRTLFVGDAAAVTDPLTGEGIGQALATGTWAADALLAAGPFAAPRALAAYEQRVERELVPDNRLADRLSRVLVHRRGAEAAVALAGTSGWTRRNFARWLFEDYPRAVLATPTRWHRGMLSGPGAFRSRSPRPSPARR